MRIVIQIVLAVVIVFLGYLLWESIAQPIRFQKEHDKRATKVIQRLKDIRKAEVAFHQKYKVYTANWDSLINFVKNDSVFEVVKNGTAPDTMSERKALELGLISRDTIKIPAIKSLFKRANYPVDSMKYVPYTNMEKFELWSGIYTSQDGHVNVPIFEVKVPFGSYLHGLDPQQITNMKLERERLGQFPGLKIGTREEPNNNAGNWIEIEDED